MRLTALLLGLVWLTMGCGGSPTTGPGNGSRSKAPPRDPAIVALEDQGAGLKPDKDKDGKAYLLVDLTRRGVSDKTFAALGAVEEPLHLIARGNKALKDDWLAPLKGNGKVQKLDLSGTRVGDAGLAHLAGLEGLEELDLHETQVTDAGMTHLRGLPKLRVLNLRGTKITSDGVPPLRGIKTLEVLNLSGTMIDDRVIGLFRGFPSLKELDIGATEISMEGQDDIFNRLPRVRVYR